MSRISILDKDRCQPKKCDYLCINYCPGVRMDEDTIVIDEDTKKPLISEQLCEGCGICTNRCPFDAISIINLPEAVGEPIHVLDAEEESVRVARRVCVHQRPDDRRNDHAPA